MDMKTKIQKWGNSLAVRVPKGIAEKAELSVEDEIDMEVQSGKVVLLPRRKPKYRLKDLVEAITDNNLHEAVDTGDPVGREAL
jgi:antitoxin MazE